MPVDGANHKVKVVNNHVDVSSTRPIADPRQARAQQGRRHVAVEDQDQEREHGVQGPDAVGLGGQAAARAAVQGGNAQRRRRAACTPRGGRRNECSQHLRSAPGEGRRTRAKLLRCCGMREAGLPRAC